MDYTKKELLEEYATEAIEMGSAYTKREAMDYARTMFEVDYQENNLIKVGRRYRKAGQLI